MELLVANRSAPPSSPTPDAAEAEATGRSQRESARRRRRAREERNPAASEVDGAEAVESIAGGEVGLGGGSGRSE